MRLWPSLLLVVGAPALSATLSGTITDSSGAGVGGGEVRLWAKVPKGHSFTAPGGQVVVPQADGRFTFSGVPAGEYLVDVRPSGGHADRWYDADGSGYVPAEADRITLTATQTLTGIDIAVQPAGGADGTALAAGALAAGLQVRLEQVADSRVHHNEDSKGSEHQGEFHPRGLPPGQYRAVVHDPNGALADAVTPAPFSVAAGMNAAVGALNLVSAPVDPGEPNNNAASATVFTVTRGAPYVSPLHSRIAPRLSDVDWYCTTAMAGERFIAHVEGVVRTEGGVTRESPWVDPVVAAFRGAARVGEDDDSGPGALDARLDTGELSAAGPLCFAVSTFGDTGFTGAAQGSAGEYRLTVTYGNRGPAVGVRLNGAPVPSTVTLNEGELLTLDVQWSDPEMDALSASYQMLGASGAVATMGSFNAALPMGTFSWRAPQTAAKDSPYQLTFRVSDSDITRVVTVNVVVTAVNVSPSVPLALAPVDGGHVGSQTPTLLCLESTDEDEETLSYEFEVYYGDAGAPAQTGSVVGRDGGVLPDAGTVTVSLVTTAIAENTFVRWRARAFDGHPGNGYSVWSPFNLFVVDVANDPPLAPVLEKPADGDTVQVRRPTFAAVPPNDPEGEVLSLFFEVASDEGFDAGVGVSPAVAVGPGATTMWTFDRDLEWGRAYWARAWAVDARNARGPFSNVSSFRVKANVPPTVPEFVLPVPEACASGFLPVKPLFAQVSNASDMEGDTIRIQLRVLLAREDPLTATPAFDQTRLQTNGVTEFDLSGLIVPKDLAHRFQARAVDAYGASAWTDCVFTVGERPTGNDGGAGGGGGQGGGGGGGAKSGGGCRCEGAELAPALLGALLLRLRRRSRWACDVYSGGREV